MLFLFILSQYKIVSFLQFIKQNRNIFRMCLHIIIHIDNDISFSIIQCSQLCICLSRIFSQVYNLDV